MGGGRFKVHRSRFERVDEGRGTCDCTLLQDFLEMWCVRAMERREGHLDMLQIARGAVEGKRTGEERREDAIESAVDGGASGEWAEAKIASAILGAAGSAL